MNIFFSENISALSLNEKESKHAIKVLRKRKGDTIYITDGKGCLYTCRITNDDPKNCQYEILEKIYKPVETFFNLAVAPVKNADRLEWLVEKTTEIGIQNIYPVICDHSERNKINIERLRKTAISAMKQSLGCNLPQIHHLIKFKDFIQLDFNGYQKFIAICSNEALEHIKNVYTPQCKNIILIGPEGDFSKEEVNLAKKMGFVPVTLGNNRLRTETAAVYACSIINMLNA